MQTPHSVLVLSEQNGYLVPMREMSPHALTKADLPVSFDRYVLESVLGEGGMAKVFRAELRGLAGFRKTVALKFIKSPEERATDFQRNLFLREARLGGLLRHPNLVDVYELGEREGELFLSMEWVDGLTLKDALTRSGPLPASVLLDIGQGLCDGLDEAHELVVHDQRVGLVHRDLKPSNVLISWNGAIKIVDFGIAQLAVRPREDSGVYHSAGSPGYMSPEQWTGDPMDHRSDLFSLGCILFEMATGDRLFKVDPKRSLRIAAQSVEERFAESGELEAIDLRVPGLAAIIRRCLRVEPAHRFQLAKHVGEAFDELAADIARKPDVSDWMSGLRRTKKAPTLGSKTTLDLNDDQEFDFSSRTYAPKTYTEQTNLPPEPNAFVGRIEELSSLDKLVTDGHRLITVLGPPGTGKTRLAKRFGVRWQEQQRGRSAWFCDLASVQDEAGVLQAVAAALDISLANQEVEHNALGQRLGHAIAGRSETLLIFDNAEQVAKEAARWLKQWWERAQNARFIITSRQPLHLDMEQHLPLAPLPVPKGQNTTSSLANNDAVRLFVERARAVKPHFELTDENGEDIAAIVRQLDGLPLALELAAARIKMWTPKALRVRIVDRFSLLRRPQTTGPRRQATLRGALDWSWDLLQPWQQAALAQLSVFQGGFDLEAAEAVIDVKEWPEAPWAIDVVASLVETSLIMVGDEVCGEPRFYMLVSVAEYAKERLEAQSPIAALGAQLRHAQFFARFGTKQYLRSTQGHGGILRRERLEAEAENIVIATKRAVDQEWQQVAIDNGMAAIRIYTRRGPVIAGLSLIDRLLTLDLSHSECARVGLSRGVLLKILGNLSLARSVYEEAIQHAKASDERRIEGILFGQLAILERRCGHDNKANEAHQIALSIHREVGNRGAEGLLLGSKGIWLQDLGRLDEAQACFKEGLTLLSRSGNRLSEGNLLALLGNLQLSRARFDEAQQIYQQALAIHQEVGNRVEEGHLLCNLGILLAHKGQIEDAQRHFELSLSINREVGYRSTEAKTLVNLGNLHQDQGRPDEARKCFQDALTVHKEDQERKPCAVILLHLGSLNSDTGNFDEAREQFNEALTHFEALGHHAHISSVNSYLGLLLGRMGEFEEAHQHFKRAEEFLRSINAPLHLAELLYNRGRAEHLAKDLDSARETLAEALDIADRIQLGTDSELGRNLESLKADVKP